MAAERKALTSFVATACGAEEAFVQKELFGEESGETRLKAHPGLESSKVLPVPLAACERDMRVKGARFGDESTKPRSLIDILLEREEFGRTLTTAAAMRSIEPTPTVTMSVAIS
jgi:hypothetical protein